MKWNKTEHPTYLKITSVTAQVLCSHWKEWEEIGLRCTEKTFSEDAKVTCRGRLLEMQRRGSYKYVTDIRQLHATGSQLFLHKLM